MQLLASAQLQLRGQVLKCWQISVAPAGAGRKTAGNPSPLRNPRATLDVQVVLSSYTALSRFYPPFLWIINIWYRPPLTGTQDVVLPACMLPPPLPRFAEKTPRQPGRFGIYGKNVQ